MSVGYRTAIAKSILILLLFVLLCAPSNAIVAELRNGTLLESQNEGEFVEYSIELTGIPKQSEMIEMKTDLMPVPGKSLWQLEGDGFIISDGDEALKENIIVVTEDGEFSDSIVITVSGRAPVLTSSETFKDIVITKPPGQTSGYVYYSIQALDENGDGLGNGRAETFSVTNPADEEFQARLNAVTDVGMRELIDDLYSRGLRNEANDLLQYAETPKDAAIPMTTTAMIVFVVIFIAFVGGMAFGQIRTKKNIEFQDDYKGD